MYEPSVRISLMAVILQHSARTSNVSARSYIIPFPLTLHYPFCQRIWILLSHSLKKKTPPLFWYLITLFCFSRQTSEEDAPAKSIVVSKIRSRGIATISPAIHSTAVAAPSQIHRAIQSNPDIGHTGFCRLYSRNMPPFLYYRVQ